MGRMADSDTDQFRNDCVSELGGMSLVTPQRGTLTSVALALFCIELDFFALTLALPDMARSFAVMSSPPVDAERVHAQPRSCGPGTTRRAPTTRRCAFALLALAASVAVLLIRHMLVRRGLMKPLSMARDQAGGAAQAGRAARRTRVG
jgi:hypothetical protein